MPDDSNDDSGDRDETIERSVTLSVALEDDAADLFGGLNRSESLRRAVFAGVLCAKEEHTGDIHKLIEMLHDERE